MSSGKDIEARSMISSEEVDKMPKVLKIALVVGFYFVVSMSIVFLNKAIMRNYEFPYPCFVTWYQVIVAVGLSYVFGMLGQRVDTLSFFPPYEYRTTSASKVAPLSFIFVGMVATNNICLNYVEISFYQVVRSLTIIMNISLTYLVLGQKTSANALKACAIVVAGFWVGAKGEINFTYMGIFFGVLSSAFVAAYSIYVKKVLPEVDNNEWKLMMYNNTNAIFVFLPVLLASGELEGLLQSELLYTFDFWVVMTITGVFGFLINIATFLQIKVTTALTSTISGTCKACLQTVISVMIFGNEVSMASALGITMTIAGSFIYSLVRYSEMQNK